MSVASSRPTRPKPSSTTSVSGRDGARPPPIFDNWKALWTLRAAIAASAPATTNEMFRSDDPWAMATTLMPLVSSAVKTRAAMPGVPAMPSPTTAMTATSRVAETPSMVPLAISSRKARRRLATARSASVSGSVNPIELSDEPWKMVETDSRSASTAANVRAAMPCTPTMPLPATVTTACFGSTATAFTG